jgi:hypothetical protein
MHVYCCDVPTVEIVQPVLKVSKHFLDLRLAPDWYES